MNYKVKVYNSAGVGPCAKGYVTYGICIPHNALKEANLMEYDTVYVNKEDDGLFVSRCRINTHNVGRRTNDDYSRTLSPVGAYDYGFCRLIIPKEYAEDLNIKIGDVLYITDCEDGKFMIKKSINDKAVFNTSNDVITKSCENKTVDVNVSILTAAEAHSMMDNYNNKNRQIVEEYLNKIAVDVEYRASRGFDKAYINIDRILGKTNIVSSITKALDEKGYSVSYNYNGSLVVSW